MSYSPACLALTNSIDQLPSHRLAYYFGVLPTPSVSSKGWRFGEVHDLFREFKKRAITQQLYIFLAPQRYIFPIASSFHATALYIEIAHNGEWCVRVWFPSIFYCVWCMPLCVHSSPLLCWAFVKSCVMFPNSALRRTEFLFQCCHEIACIQQFSWKFGSVIVVRKRTPFICAIQIFRIETSKILNIN